MAEMLTYGLLLTRSKRGPGGPRYSRPGGRRYSFMPSLVGNAGGRLTSIRKTPGVFTANLIGWINNCLVGASSL